MVFHKTREQGEGVEQTGPLLLFRVHIHTIYTGFTHFCREISLVAITRFGRQFLAKIWWEEAPKHFQTGQWGFIKYFLCVFGPKLPPKAHNRDKADFATKVRKSSINCVNLNHEQL